MSIELLQEIEELRQALVDAEKRVAGQTRAKLGLYNSMRTSLVIVRDQRDDARATIRRMEMDAVQTRVDVRTAVKTLLALL